MSKSLEITLNMEGGSTMTLNIPNPVEDLTLATVTEKAAKLIPVLRSSSNHPAVSLKKARIISTEATELK